MMLRSKINESHFLVALMGGYFGMLYNNFAPIRGVVVFCLRAIPTLHYTVDRYDCH